MKIYKGLRKISEPIDKLSKPFFLKSGGNFAQKIFFNWNFIVGDKLALASIPDKIDFPPMKRSHGTLNIKVANPAITLIISAQESQIVSKIATYFGFQVVSRVKVVVDLNAAYQINKSNTNTARPIPIDDNSHKDFQEIVDSITDDDLKSSFKNLINSFIKPIAKK